MCVWKVVLFVVLLRMVIPVELIWLVLEIVWGGFFGGYEDLREEVALEECFFPGGWVISFNGVERDGTGDRVAAVVKKSRKVQ